MLEDPRLVTGAFEMRLLGAVLVACLTLACGEHIDDAREAEIASVLARADESLIRTRPALVAGKYATMAASLHGFHRGSLALYHHDWLAGTAGISKSRFTVDGPLVLGTGDPHFENFGVLVAADGSLAIEPNDFDSADRVPYLWDLRRLAVGMVIAAEVSNPNAPQAHDDVVEEERRIARAVAEGYATAIDDLATGGARERFTAPQSNAVLADVLARSQNDLESRDELPQLTLVTNGARTLLRGAPDPADPTEVLTDLPAFVLDQLPEVLDHFRETLDNPPPPEYFELIDAVRVFGRGVASWPRVRVFLLVRGPSDDPADDVILELREIADSGVGGWYPPGEYYDSVGDRIMRTSRAAWARRDAAPLWGVSSLAGLPVQIRWEAEGQKTLRVRRLEGSLGSADVIADLARALGRLLARVHATPTHEDSNPAFAVAARIANDPEGFADEQADVAVTYAAQEEDDFIRFGRALERLGPSLGVPFSEADRPSPNLAALYGSPPVSP